MSKPAYSYIVIPAKAGIQRVGWWGNFALLSAN